MRLLSSSNKNSLTHECSVYYYKQTINFLKLKNTWAKKMVEKHSGTAGKVSFEHTYIVTFSLRINPGSLWFGK